MSEVKWIKIYTDILNNKKIKRIRKMPSGNEIVLIWIFLICEAGNSNKNGGLYLTETIPFNFEDLAIELDFEVDTIKLALSVLQRFEMLEIYDDILFIKNWEEYQNIEGMDRIREQARLRKQNQRQREKEQKLLDMSRDCHDEITPCHATDIELDKEIDKDVKKENKKTDKDIKHKYGEYKNVLLSDQQLEDLKTEFPKDWQERIERVSEYCAIHDKPYKNYLATIRAWAKKENPKKENTRTGVPKCESVLGKREEPWM